MKKKKEIYSEVLSIPKDEAEMINKYLQKGGLSEDETIINTAVFMDGCEMDIKCCGAENDDGSPCQAWTEAVLFSPEGYEMVYTDVSDQYEGEWELETRNAVYRVNVVVM